MRSAIAVEPGATCLDAASLVEHVEAWLGADSVDTELSVEVRGSPDRPRVVAFQTLRAGRVIASRRFDPGPARCEHLHAALGLAIAMAIKASLVDEISGATKSPAPEVLGPTGPGMAPGMATSRPWAIGADALAAVAVLPDPALGGDLRIERTLVPPFGVRLGFLGLVAVGETFDGSAGRFDAWLLAPRVDLCASLELGRRLRGRGCMGVSVGAIHARGYELTTSQSSLVPWFAVANGLDLSLDLTRSWSLDAGASLFLPVARNRIVVRDVSGGVLEQRDLAAAGGFFSAGPVVRF